MYFSNFGLFRPNDFKDDSKDDSKNDSKLNDFAFDVCVLDSSGICILTLPVNGFELLNVVVVLLRDSSSDILITVNRHGD